MSTNDKKVRLKIRLTEEEKAKLEHDAALCGLTQSEYFRQICLGQHPRPKQPPEFWELLDALYEIHDITLADKDRKAKGEGRNWKRQRDDAVICA